MKKTLLILCTITFLFSCNSSEKSNEEASDEYTMIPDDHNSRNSVDWQGMYSGVLPCADCEGIRITLALQEDTYRLTRTYLVKDSFSNHSEGEFIWSEDGSSITLSGIENMPTQYQVGENKLFQLDMEGNRITGALADHYILTKASSPILDITWKLIELNGKTVEVKGIKPFNLLFDTTIGIARGFAGCNGFSGEFEVKEEKLKLFGVFHTELACEPSIMEVESAYIKALNELDNFALEGEVLVLKKGDIVLAKLVKEG